MGSVLFTFVPKPWIATKGRPRPEYASHMLRYLLQSAVAMCRVKPFLLRYGFCLKLLASSDHCTWWVFERSSPSSYSTAHALLSFLRSTHRDGVNRRASVRRCEPTMKLTSWSFAYFPSKALTFSGSQCSSLKRNGFLVAYQQRFFSSRNVHARSFVRCSLHSAALLRFLQLTRRTRSSGMTETTVSSASCIAVSQSKHGPYSSVTSPKSRLPTCDRFVVGHR
mmetsp:Transcript_52818/g.162606  ORF Transcript_52818/g.162606 Transcript_52818/m.162606 type:complete len:223 (-) Transcript_52818:789-1457(-)